MKYLSLAVTVLAAACTQVASQDLPDLFSEPTQLWSFQLPADVNLGPTDILKGNGVFLGPDGVTAYVTTVGATVYAFNAYTGAELWSYQPATVGTSITRSHSGLSFGPTADYMVYSVVDNENSLTPETRVIALDFTGAEVWISEPLDGVPSGEPLISSDSAYVFVVHNANEGSTGYFTILDATGAVFLSEPSEGDGNSTAAFGPPGIYWTPVQGNYDPIVEGATVSEGDFNTNDMIMWSETPKPTDVTVQNGFMFGFQFPREFDPANSTSTGYFQLGSFERDFQSITPPVMTNGGLSAYWSVTRSAFQGWASKRFSRARTNQQGFTRNDANRGQACFAAPVLSSTDAQPFVFGGTAGTQFVRLNFDLSESVAVTTSALIKSKAAVDGENRAVYYVTENGMLHQADFDTLETIWNYTINFSVEGEMAMTPNSAVIIVPDTRGVIQAIQVSDFPQTDAPVEFPSDMPSIAPSGLATISPAPVAGGEASLLPTDVLGNETETDFPTPAPSGTAIAPSGAAPVAPPVAGPPTPTAEGGVVPTMAPVPPSAGTRPMMAVALVAGIACLLF